MRWAVMYLGSRRAREFEPGKIRLLEAIGTQAGIAVQKVRLFEAVERRAKEQEALNVIATATNQSLDLKELFEIAADKTVMVTERQRINFRLKDPLTGKVNVVAYRGFTEEEIEALRRITPHPMSEQVFASGKPLVINDHAGPGVSGLLARTQSVAWIPVKAGSKVVGVLGISDDQSRPFTPNEVELLQAIGSVIGVAIENARLFEQTRKQAAELEQSNKAKDELLVVMAQQKEELSRLNAGLECEIAERGRARAEIAAKNRDLETLLYVTSHDLREPLRAIENFSRIVNDRYSERLDDKGQDFLRRIISGAQRLNRLLDDILTLSRSQRIGVASEEVDGESIVTEALKRLEGKINATRARIHVAKDFQGLRVDKTWATQAVYNLIANALKFTREGEAPDVEVAPYRPQGPGRNAIGIAVRDRGPGIAPEHAERIFQLFQRAVGREVEGTGAGLAIVRQIAERHGGSAWVEPRQGGGSEFIITFGRRKRFGRRHSSIMDTQPMEILLVEDNEDDILLEQEALADAKLVNLMCVVRDGEEAMAYLRRQGKYQNVKMPGLILLDINMPKKNGFEVLNEIKSDPALMHIPVVMLTTSDSEADIVKSYAKGACSYITKPMDFDKFKDVVKQFALYWVLVARVPSRQG